MRSDPPRFPRPLQHKGEKFIAKWADEARFIRTWLEHPRLTGAVSPSGPALADAMAAKVDPAIPGLVIELGPGTGPMTEALIRRGIAPERLVLVEFDAAFCRLLQTRFPSAQVVQGDAYHLAQTLAGLVHAPVAAVVSSLPLLTRPDAERLSLLADAFALMPPNGVFVQFTYGLNSPIPRRVNGGLVQGLKMHGSKPIWRNLPPARVWTYRPSAEALSWMQTAPAPVLRKSWRQHWRVQTQKLRREGHLRPAFALLARMQDKKPPRK